MGAMVFKQDDDLVDPVRYIVSRQPQYVQRNPHQQNAFNYERSVIYPKDAPIDPNSLDEGMRVHLLRLKATDNYPISTNVPFGQMPTGRLNW